MCAGQQRAVRQLAAEIAPMYVGDDLAAVVLCHQELARDLVDRKTVGAGNFQGAVQWRTNGQVGQQGRDIIGSDRLHQRRRQPRHLTIDICVDDAADELEELRGPHDGVGNSGTP